MRLLPTGALRHRWLTASRCAAALILIAAHARVAVAQTAARPPDQPPVTAGWNDGFFLQTPNGDNRLQIGAVLQVDGRFALDDPLPITNTFVMRKARPTFTGRVAKFIDFKLMPELAGSVTLLDAYFDIRFSTKLRVRSGKDKTPVGYEMLLGDAYLIFPERSVVSLLVPNRDVGFQAQGDLAGGRLTYAGGIFNGNPVDGTVGCHSTYAAAGCCTGRSRRLRLRCVLQRAVARAVGVDRMRRGWPRSPLYMPRSFERGNIHAVRLPGHRIDCERGR